MTVKLKGLTVAFSHDIREDDAKNIIDAILMIKGVSDVTQKHIVDPGDYITRKRILNEIVKSILVIAEDQG
jgi:hypothetical protein